METRDRPETAVPGPGETAADPSRDRRRARFGRRLRIGLGVVAGLAIVVRAALPWAIEQGAERAVRRLTGLEADVGDVDLWLLRGAIALEDGVVAARPGEPLDDAGSAAAVLRWRRLYLNVGWLDLLRGRVHVQEVSLDGPGLRFEEGAEGGIDLAFLSGLPAPEPAPAEEPGKASEPWPVQLDSVAVTDLRVEVTDPEPASDPLVFSLGELSLQDLSLEEGSLGLGAISIRAPVLEVERDFVLGWPTGSGTAAGPSEEVPPPRPAAPGGSRTVERLALEGADIRLIVGDRPLHVSFQLEADRMSLRQGAFPVRLSLGIEDGSFELQGELALAPPGFRGHVEWNELPVPPLALVAVPEMGDWMRSCRAGGTLDVELLAGEGDLPTGLRLGAGSISVRDLDVASPGDTTEVAIGWNDLTIGVEEVFVPLGVPAAGQPPAPRIALGDVRLESPRIRYRLPSPSLDALLAADADAVPGAEAPAPEGDSPSDEETHAAVAFSIDTFAISGGRIDFDDRSVSPGFRARLEDLAISGRDVAWPERRVRELAVSMGIPPGASLRVDGHLDATDDEVRIELKELALPPFDPYAQPAGYRLRRGAATLESTLEKHGSEIEMDNDITLHHLALDGLSGNRFQETFGMPLDLTLALLRGPSGDIKLSVPVSFDETGAADTGLTSIVRSAVRQALVGAVTSPLKLAGFAFSMFGGGGPSADAIPFAPAAAVLGEAETERVDALARLLASRPGLAVELSGTTGEADRPGLAEAVLTEGIVNGEDLPDLEESGFLARRRVAGALRDRAEGKPGELSEEDDALLRRYLESVDVPAERWEELARRRADAVRVALIEEHAIEESRITVVGPSSSGEPGVVPELGSL